MESDPNQSLNNCIRCRRISTIRVTMPAGPDLHMCVDCTADLAELLYRAVLFDYSKTDTYEYVQ